MVENSFLPRNSLIHMKLSAQYKNNSSFSKSTKGFTLIEIIVVMAIIISLAGIGFGVFFQMNKTARENETQTILEAVSNAMIARSADISAEQRATVGIQTGFTFPNGNGSDGSTEDLVSYISGDFDGDGKTDEGAETKLPEVSPTKSGKNSYLDEDGRIIDSWNTPIRYTFPGVYHTEDDGFDLQSAGPDRTFDTDDDIILK